MVPYIIFYFVIFILSFKIKQNKWDIFDFLILIIIICFSGFRYGIGVDYSLYEMIFEECKKNVLLAATNRTGIGFSYIMNFLGNKLNFNFEMFVFLCSLITIFCFYVFFKKYSKKPGLTILLYISLGFYTSSFNGFRQQLSLSLALLGYLFLKEKKYIRCIFIFLLSFAIHSSSILPILLFVLFNHFKNWNIKAKYVFIPSMIFFLFYNILFVRIISLFDEYSGYIDYDSSSGIGTIMMVSIYLITTNFFILKQRNKLTSLDSNNIQFINLLIVGVALMILQIKNWLFVRFATDFTIFIPLILSEYYYAMSLKNKKLKSLIFYCFIFIYFIFYINSFGGVVPYKTIFNK